MFNAGGFFNDDNDPQLNDEDHLFDEAPAFSEHSAIRNTYMHAHIASASQGALQDVSHIILDGVARALWYACNHTR